MKEAHVITSDELDMILKNHLTSKGYDCANMQFQCLAASIVVVGLTLLEQPQAEPESFDDEEDDDEDDGWNAEQALTRDDVLETLEHTPRTVQEMAKAMDLDVGAVATAVNCLLETGEVAKVAPAREDGRTISMFMKTGTTAYEDFVEFEKSRVERQIHKWAPTILAAAPKFYEKGRDRMQILEEICSCLSHDSAEELRKDCRNVFYGMAERQMLYHSGHAWKAFRTETDVKNMDMLRRSVEEIVPDHEDRSLDEIVGSLPGEVDRGLLRHVLSR